MTYKIEHCANGTRVAVVNSEIPILTDAQTALDLIASMQFNDGCFCLAINKAAIAEDFFKLSTGLAGEILQKFVNYSARLAIIGDFSCYTGKPLRDFIYESNNGNAVFFLPSLQAALDKFSNSIRV